jgi:prepilin-type N-terminal cleavage/methylation domain-containing protein
MHPRYEQHDGFGDAGEVAVESAMRESKRGVTLVELVIAMMVMVVLLAVAIPAFMVLLQRSQLDGAVRQLMSDVRTAQSRATLTAWQYRLVGYDNDSGTAYSNQYRVIGRSSSAVAWPVDTIASFNSATQMAGPWFNVNTAYPDVKLDTADSTTKFYVSYDSRGVAFEINSFPLNISHKSGQKQCLGVTAAGSIRMVTCP